MFFVRLSANSKVLLVRFLEESKVTGRFLTAWVVSQCPYPRAVQGSTVVCVFTYLYVFSTFKILCLLLAMLKKNADNLLILNPTILIFLGFLLHLVHVYILKRRAQSTQYFVLLHLKSSKLWIMNIFIFAMLF